METLGRLFQMCVEFSKTEFEIYGFTVSFWGIFIFGVVVDVIALLIGGFLSGK